MNSTAYTAMVEQMEKGAYTEVNAKKTIANLYARQMITDDEYNDLMDKADALAANTPDGEALSRIVALESAVKSLQSEVAALKEAVTSGSTEIPEPEPGQTGAEDDPIDAVRGMTYYKDKYYRDPNDGQVYQCYRDSDSHPGSGVALAYLPHELVNIYFYFTRVS